MSYLRSPSSGRGGCQIPDNLLNALFVDQLWSQLSGSEQLDVLLSLCYQNNVWQSLWCERLLTCREKEIINGLLQAHQQHSGTKPLKDAAKKALLLYLFVLNIDHLEQPEQALPLLIDLPLTAALFKGLMALNRRDDKDDKDHESHPFWLLLSLPDITRLLKNIIADPELKPGLGQLAAIYQEDPDIYEYLSPFVPLAFD